MPLKFYTSGILGNLSDLLSETLTTVARPSIILKPQSGRSSTCILPLALLAPHFLFNLLLFSTEFTTLVLSLWSSGMATFPNITALNYSVRKGHNSLYQESLPAPRFEFQFTSNFDFYPVGSQDYEYLDPPDNHFAHIRPDIASCLWESLKMKVRYILSAARNGDSHAAFDLLTTFISNAKLREVDMLPPPFPPAHQLVSNPFLRPGHPSVVDTWVSSWQTTSRMLAAWIAKAQENSSRNPNSSWCWPVSPRSLTPITDSISDSDSTDVASTTTEFNSISDIESAPPAQAVLASHARATLVPLKRTRDSSPVDSIRDGDDPSKKQLVLWRPSITQILEAQRALATGEISSGTSISSTPHVPPPSYASSFTLDPRLQNPRPRMISQAPSRHTLAESLARIQRLHNFNYGSSAR